MSLADILILAVVQGLTEFLPVSSDGHLAVVEAFLRVPEGSRLALTVVLHAGTLLAILVVYYRAIGRIVTRDWRLLGPLLVATIPAGVVGLVAREVARAWLENALLAGICLPITGLVLLIMARRRRDGAILATDLSDVSYGQALIIGLAQATALLPGISRSGMTISAGLAVGLRREAAATFSFLMAIPVVGGAVTVEGLDLLRQPLPALPMFYLACGIAVAFFVGWVALKWVLAWLEGGKLHYFAWWCIPLGAAVVVWQVVK